MILLASEILDAGVNGRQALPLSGIDMTVRRNAFGRQVDSFEGDVAFAGLDGPVRAVFIRAPRIAHVGEGVQVLGTVSRGDAHGLEPVIVEDRGLIGCAFHPELTGDLRLHERLIARAGG